ncbi:fluoride efflux transporter CrcB [Novosphingobium mangrovi (ex Hu et al. 2023)]|uniref:Fluoride-specific ion channel FluC n=1 Tax=Novosphingobium mangrovi (ex Hu et al. 2023) TaxID=2930094 RepID=A0ABT0AH56_9SPHN|nr:fluoride efflux transporter CrcB [Novosphingobium mangrovi (ex Hu et al. 2023)]MCJ1962502.1 fluoride efflux transporter CrcB [Novosphingobium mangrovi (ex Hu et al. 2023)]
MPQPSFLAASLFVALGGGTGAWLRFLVGRAWTAALGPARAGVFPYGTLTVNVLGSLFMGLLIGALARYGSHGEGTRLFIAVGLLGGFTTFSSFSLDFITILERGQPGLAALYVGASLLAGFAGLFLGLLIMRSI